METVVFYSYKGGTGRTLALAQFADVLRKVGKSVFVLDLDLGAPGVPYKFIGPYGWTQIPHYGLVQYMAVHRRDAELHERLDTKTITTLPGLTILPAGNPFDKDEEYFNTYTEPGFQEFLALDPSSDTFFSGLKAKIETDYRPNYLLIDSPSGVSRVAAVCVQLLADTVVLLTGNNIEGKSGTNYILKAIRKARRRPATRVFCALTRLPKYSEEGRIPTDPLLLEIRDQALREINVDLDRERVRDLFLLAAAPELALAEGLPLSDPRMTDSQLVQDYVELFSAIDRDLEEFLAPYRLPAKDLRPFMLVHEQGRMINPVDNSFNVAMRVSTLVGTLSSLADAVEKQGGNASELLFGAGMTAAGNFSGYLRELWQKRNSSGGSVTSTKDKIKEWCEFDSTVGFGKFESKPWGDGAEGSIELEHNFLIADRSKKDRSLCPFMRGYISRILTTIFEAEVDVTHKEVDCGQFKTDQQKKCVFRYGPSAGKREGSAKSVLKSKRSTKTVVKPR